MKYYIVGGAVRDLLMGRMPHDADMAFEGTVEDFLTAFPTAQKVGKTVHVYLVDGTEYMPLHANSLTADLLHRDLTINALALEACGCIHAHPLAFFDIRHKILRPTSAKAFFHDPTRIYRLARFASTFSHFSVHEEAIRQAYAVVKMQAHAHLPAERVGREFFKALFTEKPSLFLQILKKYHALEPWFQECQTLDSEAFWKLGQCMDAIESAEVLQSTALQNKSGQNIDAQSEHEQSKEKKHEKGQNKQGHCAYWQKKMPSVKDIGLLRFMLWGHFFPPSSSLKKHPLYQLVNRLHLPLHFAKAAFFLSTHCHQAKNLAQIALPAQIAILHQAHVLGISHNFWQAIAFLYNVPHTQRYAQHALACIQKVHLPEEWCNKGEFSGKKLLEMQCAALQKTFRKR